MTMQVAMVGSDGIVLASDTRWANTINVNNAALRHTFQASKIKTDHQRGLVVSYARNMETAGAIADAILALEEHDWKYPIIPIEEASKPILELAGERTDAHCLIIATKPSMRLILFQVARVNGRDGQPICHEIRDKAIAGDNANPALFWLERYYERRPIQYLVPLAAQVVVAASRLNSAAIGGLEIVVCDERGIHRLSDESIAILESKARDWDAEIGAQVSGCCHRFTYDPRVIG